MGEERRIIPTTAKRGPGRPRKVVGTGKASKRPKPKGRKKKVSANEGTGSRKTPPKTKKVMEKATTSARSKEEPREGVRRSPRLQARTAVT